MRSPLVVGIIASAILAVGCGRAETRITATDPDITASVKSQLVTDDLVKARQIDVATRDRVVTLSGRVSSSDEESRVLEIAYGTKGVADVVNHLAIVAESERPAATSGHSY